MKVTTIFDRLKHLNGCPWVPTDKHVLEVQIGPKTLSPLTLSDLGDVIMAFKLMLGLRQRLSES